MPGLSLEKINNMLDYVDCPTDKSSTKRRDAYVTEWYFQEIILPKITKNNVSTGWCYVEHKNSRHWFKAFNNPIRDDMQRQYDRLVISLLNEKDVNQRFFSIYNNGQFIEIREILITGENWIQRRIEDGSKICNIVAINAKIKELYNKSKHNSPFSNIWLNNLSYNYKEALLLQRLLMNFGLSGKYPLDVDAIEITGDNKLVFHEFKRKTKCPNGCFEVYSRKIDKRFLLEVLNKSIRLKPKNEQELFEYIENRLLYKRNENLDCYGLDLSHVSNFSFCLRNNIKYAYTIWDSSDYSDKPSLDKLFNKNITLKGSRVLYSLDVNENSFIGFVFTNGDNSGTYNKKHRIQAALNADQFKSLTFSEN